MSISDMHSRAAARSHVANSSEEDVSENSPLLRSHSRESGSSRSSLSTESGIAYQIPPADHGKAAWSFLAGCFLIEGLIWGLPFSYGVFEKYYSEHELFAKQPGGIAAGILYFLSPVAVIALQRWPSLRLHMTLFGQGVAILALVAASFADSVTDLIFTQGALYGIGGAFLYNPFVFYLDEWFIERKGLAFGILWAGTGISGTMVPVIMEWGLERYGFRTMLRACAVVLILLVTPLLFVVRPRLPTPAKGTVRPLHLGFLRNITFWVFQVGNVLEGFGYFMPSIYLPSYAASIGLSSFEGTFAVSILNFASVIGTIFTGSLTDHLHVTTVILVSALGSALSAFLLWGFALSKTMLYIFALAYGIFAGGYTATWTGCLAEVQRDSRDAEAGVFLGMMAATRGLGAIVSGPISEELLKLGLGAKALAGAYGSKYGVVIVFTGVTAVLGGFGIIERVRIWGMDDDDVESIGEIRRTHEGFR